MSSQTIVGNVADLPVGTMKLVRVDGRRLCLVRTSDGVHALDNACPHEGYGLTQGTLSGDLLTCQWHNWKFRVSDGRCVLGEENVPVHDVHIGVDGTLCVTLVEPLVEERRTSLLASLRRGITNDYSGQIARETVRLLRLSINPGELVWEAVQYGAPRAEYGWGHSIAAATDCLAAVDLYDGDSRAFPVVQAVAGIAETERGRPVNPLPDPVTLPHDPAKAFRCAVEAEDVTVAQSLVLGAIHSGLGPSELQPWFTAVVCDHHLSYGHGAIYAQKAFQLLDRLGWDRATTVLPHLVPTLVYATREDTLPYMRPFLRALATHDLSALTDHSPDHTWSDDGQLVAALLGRDKVAPITTAVAALRAGAGVDGLLDAASTAVSLRMLRYDTAGERDLSDDFGWLDITHGLTYANAARWHATHSPGPDTLRLALFACFLAHWTGRHEWHTSVGEPATVEARTGDDRAFVGARTGDLHSLGETVIRNSMLDISGAFIVQVHAIKMARAASEEALRLGSSVPIDATVRFMTAARTDRFVASTVQQSIDFVSGRVSRD